MVEARAPRWFGAPAAVALALLSCTGDPGSSAAPPAGLTAASLPAGTSIEVGIDTPADGAIVLPGPLSLTGSARIGVAPPLPTDLVLVLDASSNTVGAGPGCANDQNGDGLLNTALDCEIAALRVVNQQVIDAGSASHSGFAAFALEARHANMSPVENDQPLTPPGADLDHAGGQDVDQVIKSVNVDVGGGNASIGLFTLATLPAAGTSFGAGLQQVAQILSASSAVRKLVVLVSTDPNDQGPAIGPAIAALPPGTIVDTIAAGPASHCGDAGPGGFGSLQQIADLTGGTCTEVPDMADLLTVAPTIVRSRMNEIALTVDGSPAAIGNVTPALPADGPASFAWQATVDSLAAGPHTICATARGQDAGGPGSVSACITITVQSPNMPPVARCRDVVVTANAMCGASASVDDGSSDPDGDPITCVQSPPGPFGLGTTAVTLTCSDAQGASASCAANVTVVDTTPPTVTTTGAGSLWPPNHKYVPRTLSSCGVSIRDQCQGVISLDNAQAAITCVTSDEVENDGGDGDTSADMVIVNPTTVNLRAERSGNLDGRVYQIHFRVVDAAGNVGTGVCAVTVPHDQGGGATAVDSGVHFTVGNCN